MPQFSEQDYILLSGYLDGRLDVNERAEFEARLAADFSLRAELESLQQTLGLLKMAERVRVPRSFTLDPALYAKPVRRSFWDSIGLGRMPSWAMAGASLVVVFLCIGAMIINGNIGLGGGVPAGEAPPAAAMLAQEATEAATEAQALENATEASLFAATMPDETPATKYGPPAAIDPTEESAGGIGGGIVGGTTGGDGSSMPSPYPQPESGAGESGDAAAGNPASDTASAARNSGEQTPLPYSTIEVTEAQPYDGLGPLGWTILGGATALLLIGVLGVTYLKRRR